MANALPLLLLGGAALYYFSQKDKEASNGGASSNGSVEGTLDIVPCAHEIKIITGEGFIVGDHKMANQDELKDYTYQLALNGKPVVLFLACSHSQELLSGINNLCKEFKNKADFMGMYAHRTSDLDGVILEKLCLTLDAAATFAVVQSVNGQIQESTIENTPQLIIRELSDLQGAQSVLRSLLG